MAGIAGSIGYSGDGGPATAAQLDYPFGVAVDLKGNVYIVDTYNHAIRMVSVDTNIITTVAGFGSYGYSGDGGPATSATMNQPEDVAVDVQGNIYIADTENNAIRMVTKSTGNITTVAGAGSIGNSGDGGPATSAMLNHPYGVAVDVQGNIYIADTNNNVIRKVNISTGIITTVAGFIGSYGYVDGGPATLATLFSPTAVAVDVHGNIYIVETVYTVIRMVNISTGNITTVAGIFGSSGYSGDGGLATAAQLNNPQGVAFDTAGNIYIADYGEGSIRMINSSTGIITSVATGIGAYGVAVDLKGHVYIADRDNDIIQMIALTAPTSSFRPARTNSSTATPIFASTKTSAAKPRTSPTLLAYLFISPFICFLGQLFFSSSW